MDESTMKRTCLLLAVVVAFAVPLHAQWSYVKNLAAVTIAGTAVTVFTAADITAGAGHPQATTGVCKVVTANVRYTIDGQTPTTSFGLVAYAGDSIVVNGTQPLLNLAAIRDDSTSATLDCVVAGP